MKKPVVKPVNKLNSFLCRFDSLSLWWVGPVLLGIVLMPILALGEGSVFAIHDQLDESMMNYVLTARHFGQSVFPEMLGGVSASGLQPSAVLFVPLYRVLSPFWAFLCTYGIIFLCGFAGMYLAVREMTDSSILAVAAAGVFCMLPFYPVYGLSQMGIPLVLYAFLCLCRRKRRAWALVLAVFFGLTSHLVYTGYAVLAFWAAALAVRALHGRNIRQIMRWEGLGFALLLVTFCLTNHRLFAEILFGQGGYVSHREEMVNGALPFGQAVREIFLEGQYHAPSYHSGLILPIVVLLAAGAVIYRRLGQEGKRRYLQALGGMAVLVGIALFYGLCKSEPVTAWKNSVGGFLHYFQAERLYWLYPAGWYLELALAFSVWWTEGKRICGERSKGILVWSMALLCLAFTAVLYPTAREVLYSSYFYENVNQYNNGSAITGYISWESWYAEELMQELEEAIGRDPDSYRVAHLGISPAPALMHGFYTVDGYSNNYSLEYKHAFRRVIAAELEKAPDTAIYFDRWGNRCYLFNSLTGSYWMMQKGDDIRYEGLEFDMEALADLGCAYLFSGGEIVDAERLGLEPMGYFETEDSCWGIWLYALRM